MPAGAEMAIAPKAAENSIGLEEIHTERQEHPKGGFVLAGLEIWVVI